MGIEPTTSGSDLPLLVTECYAAQHSYVPLLSLRRDLPLKSSSTFSVRPRSSIGRVTVDLIRRSWVRFPPRSKYFFFTSCGSLIPFASLTCFRRARRLQGPSVHIRKNTRAYNRNLEEKRLFPRSICQRYHKVGPIFKFRIILACVCFFITF